ncbi:hypothetical protein [Brevibacillus gelatini]|uniref:hypothetical protein n=1 Tax=Brevibacillus gelatini TaxID=1655277 RepID=UPI001B867B11|nr:hypothetical protein [Brevibacillus gelatini]
MNKWRKQQVVVLMVAQLAHLHSLMNQKKFKTYGCLPSAYDIIQMKKKSGHNWACHGNESVMCGGFVQYVREYHPELDLSVGNLISYKTWYYEGEEVALIEVSTKSN